MHVAMRPRSGGSNVKVKEYGHDGLTFVQGTDGEAYSVVLKNNGPDRAMFVVSVDGLSVIDGKPATKDSDGYVLEGYSSVEIKGWRTSLETVQEFVFKSKDKSYAAGTEAGSSNCGVIACLVFAEKEKEKPASVFNHHYHHYQHPVSPAPRLPRYPVYPHYPAWPDIVWATAYKTAVDHPNFGVQENSVSYSASVETRSVDSSSTLRSCSLSAAKPDQEALEFTLGTGWGEAATSRVRTVRFEAGPEIAAMNVYYADSSTLRSLGIVLEKVAALSLPQGFKGFCQPPSRTK